MGKKKKKGFPSATTLRRMSEKQIRRTINLKKKLKQMIREFELRGITANCQKCGCTTRKLVADHVQTRNEFEADKYINLGVLCVPCNQAKGSVREEYRQLWFIKRMIELDEEQRKIDELKRING